MKPTFNLETMHRIINDPRPVSEIADSYDCPQFIIHKIKRRDYASLRGRKNNEETKIQQFKQKTEEEIQNDLLELEKMFTERGL